MDLKVHKDVHVVPGHYFNGLWRHVQMFESSRTVNYFKYTQGKFMY